ncbi:MAG: metalloprotease TldD, partial [Gammaproteobacteria bacterium]|nr:metalloprotease TldD [Gammaproteobacteria bacterium]
MSEQALDIARQRILDRHGLDDAQLSRSLGTLMGHAIDNADLYFQVTRHESWSLEDGIVKEGSHSLEQGVGVRAMSGEKTGFAYSDELVLPALTQAAKAARAIARQGGTGRLQAWHAGAGHDLYPAVDPLETLGDIDKVRLLERVDAEARRADPRVRQVMASLTALHEVVLVVGSDGTFAADVRPLVRLSVAVIVEQDGRREHGSSGGGGRWGYAGFLENERALGHAREAVRQALVNLEAVAAPAGSMTVVLGPGWPGVLLHEAIGHGLEGDFHRKGTSAFAGRCGERVA